MEAAGGDPADSPGGAQPESGPQPPRPAAEPPQDAARRQPSSQDPDATRVMPRVMPRVSPVSDPTPAPQKPAPPANPPTPAPSPNTEPPAPRTVDPAPSRGQSDPEPVAPAPISAVPHRSPTPESEKREPAPTTPPAAATPAPTTPPTDDPPTDTPAREEPAPTDADTAASTRSSPRRHGLHRPPTPVPGKARRARRLTMVGRVVVALACVMALVGTGFVWGYLKVFNGNFKNIAAVNPDDSNIRNKSAQTGDQNYLIVGTDTRAGQNGKVGAGTTAEAGGARSDTVILINIPASRSRVVAVSFPRDLQIDRPDCEQWNNDTGTYTGQNIPAEYGAKLNTAYGEGGPKCAVDVIQKMSGLNINHFIGMDFFGFEQVVNKLGGVQVCSKTPLYDYELGDILTKAGPQTISGSRALNYVRARTVETEGNGDYGRIKRQQLFMSSLLRSVLSNKVLSNPAKMTGIINTFTKYSVVDNVTTDDLLDLGQSMQGLQAGRVSFLTVPTAGTTTDGSNNEIPRTEDINAIFNAIINDGALPGEAKAAPSTSAGSARTSTSSSTATTPSAAATPTPVSASATNPGEVGVRVLNGTGTSGLAGGVSDQLSQDGFDVRGIADASQPFDTTVVRYGPGQRDAAATLAAMFPGSRIQQDSQVRSGVEVILGKGYTGGTIGQLPAAGSALTTDEVPEYDGPSSALPDDLAVTNAADTTCN
nr:LCP family protein [Williamsia sterculiae]